MFGKIKKRVWQVIQSRVERDFENQRAALSEDFKKTLEDLRQQLLVKKYEQELELRKIDDEVQNSKDLKVKLEKTNEDLKQQIRLIEAKASPDGVFIEAFSLGASKTWDLMADVIGLSYEKAKDLLISRTRDEERSTVKRLVEEKINKLDSRKLRDALQVEAKLAEFEEKLLAAEKNKDKEAAMRYKNYIDALKWRFDEKTT